MNKVIYKYLIYGFLKTVMNVVLVFICLGVILNLFEEIEFFKKLDDGIRMSVVLTIMVVPNLIIKLLPFIIFISAMWYLLSIRNNTDLLSLKIFGFSNIKIISILSFTALIFGFVILLTINPVTSAMVKYYEQTKAQYAKDIDHLVSINKNGVWIKEIINEKLMITTAKKLDNNFLFNVTIYKLNDDNSILQRIESDKVNVINNNWILKKATIYNFYNGKNEIEEKNDYIILSKYNLNQLNTLYKNLDTISFIRLITEYDDLKQKGYSKQLLDERLNYFLSLPIFLFLMVVLASIFIIGSVNRTQNLYYIFISIIACVIIYYFKDLSVALGQTNRISLALAVWMPIIAISLFCSIGVIQINEK